MDGSTSTYYYCFKSRLCTDFKLKSLVGNKDALSQISSFISVVLCTIHSVKQLHIDTQENNKINGTSYGNMHQTNVMEKKYILCLCF